MTSCHYCATTTEPLRPYGPGGAPVCFDCGTHPDHRAQTGRSFEMIVRAAVAMSPTGNVVLDADGIHPHMETQ